MAFEHISPSWHDVERIHCEFMQTYQSPQHKGVRTLVKPPNALRCEIYFAGDHRAEIYASSVSARGGGSRAYKEKGIDKVEWLLDDANCVMVKDSIICESPDIPDYSKPPPKWKHGHN